MIDWRLQSNPELTVAFLTEPADKANVSLLNYDPFRVKSKIWNMVNISELKADKVFLILV